MSTRMAEGVSTNTTRSASRRITIFSSFPLPFPFPLVSGPIVDDLAGPVGLDPDDFIALAHQDFPGHRDRLVAAHRVMLSLALRRERGRADTEHKRRGSDRDQAPKALRHTASTQEMRSRLSTGHPPLGRQAMCLVELQTTAPCCLYHRALAIPAPALPPPPARLAQLIALDDNGMGWLPG